MFLPIRETRLSWTAQAWPRVVPIACMPSESRRKPLRIRVREAPKRRIGQCPEHTPLDPVCQLFVRKISYLQILGGHGRRTGDLIGAAGWADSPGAATTCAPAAQTYLEVACPDRHGMACRPTPSAGTDGRWAGGAPGWQGAEAVRRRAGRLPGSLSAGSAGAGLAAHWTGRTPYWPGAAPTAHWLARAARN